MTDYATQNDYHNRELKDSMTAEECSRSACRVRRAYCIHKRTGRYYCPSCMHKINRANSQELIVRISDVIANGPGEGWHQNGWHKLRELRIVSMPWEWVNKNTFCSGTPVRYLGVCPVCQQKDLKIKKAHLKFEWHLEPHLSSGLPCDGGFQVPEATYIR